ncbi:MAG: exonuclease subunit SbcD [Bacteroidota bacterium]
MKILHTADWHIGKKLHKHELKEDFELFINWLCTTIIDQKIDLLLVSGDIFDLANPSSEARKQYFQALFKLQKLDIKIVITGGNHDSPSMLNGPSELIKLLNINIIGGLPEQLEEAIIPISNKEGEVELVVAALPYLRDADLRQAVEGQDNEERKKALLQGIENTFQNAAEICKKQYPEIPAIAMGHLFAAGMETSESEREIQIGNLAAFNANHFGEHFNYIALGHIHKPQQVKAKVPTFYSGSPIPLSFSEYDDQKRVLIIDTNDFQIESLGIPVFRKLMIISGELESLKHKLNILEPQSGLHSLIELILKEDEYSAQKMIDFEMLIDEFKTKGYEIVKHKTEFKHQLKGSSEIFEKQSELKDLKPTDVFSKMIDTQEYDERTKEEVLDAFQELLENLDRTED